MNNEWSTPQSLFDKLNDEFNFTLDACASSWNFKCEDWFDKKQDGLSKKWSGIVWLNPPYGNEIKHWIRKAFLETYNGVTTVCLIPSRTETNWFHDYCLKGELRFIRGRIHFADINGKTGRPRFGSVVVIFRANSQ